MSFSNDEVVILLYHGKPLNVIKKYNKSISLYRHNCGTGGYDTKSDNRKKYESLLKEPASKFDEAWQFFYADFLLNTKLDFLHSIHNGEIVKELPEMLAEAEKHFEPLKNKKYDNNDPKMRENLKNLRDAVLKIR